MSARSQAYRLPVSLIVYNQERLRCCGDHIHGVDAIG